MIDFHCHLDLYKNPLNVFESVKARGDIVLAVTTSPRAFAATSKHFKGAENVILSLGFHPELISQRPNEIKLFFDYMENCKFLGEIGMDASPRFKSSLVKQKEFFEEVVIKSESTGGRIMSIHSRGATKEVLGILESHLEKSHPILHWFTGAKREVEKAISIGCWFSINPNMCISKSGREVIDSIPVDRLLPETDAPFAQKNGLPYLPWDNQVVEYLAFRHGMTADEMNKQVYKNLENVLSLS